MNQWKKRIASTTVAVMLLLTTARADGFGDTSLATGTINLVHDVTRWLMLLCPAVGVAAALMFLSRRGMADEADGKMWNKRIIVAIVCGVGGFAVSGLISGLTSYYK